MERGELVVGSQPQQEESENSSTANEKEQHQRAAHKPTEEPTETEKPPEARDDNPPDGLAGNDDETMEWQEGKTLVVEHHIPGEEVIDGRFRRRHLILRIFLQVEVEVLQNPHNEESSETDLKNRFKTRLDDVTKEVRGEGRSSESGDKSAKNNNNDDESVQQALGATVGEESEDGWRDIDENNEPMEQGSSSRKPSIARRAKRHRNSIRRSMLTKNTRLPRVREESSSEDHDDGRRNRHSRSKADLQHAGISLPAREPSPARSVHWKDRERSGVKAESDAHRVQFSLP